MGEFEDKHYTSAKLQTHKAWRYGKLSARAKLPHGDARGTWPAIWMLPREWKYGDFAERTITWAKFLLGGTEIMFFNTHLPHNHGQARSKNSHARIAKSLLKKRAELGAGNMPTVIVGDMNTFASQGAQEGSFESNLLDAGWHKSYQAQGTKGGHSGLDQIFNTLHWTSSNRADRGTGGSDHTSIAVDVTLRG